MHKIHVSGKNSMAGLKVIVFIAFAFLTLSPNITSAESIVITGTYSCRLDEDGGTRLIVFARNKQVKFPSVLTKLSNNVAKLQSTLRKLKKRKASQASIDAVKTKITLANSEKQNINKCRRKQINAEVVPVGANVQSATLDFGIASFYDSYFKFNRCMVTTFVKFPLTDGKAWNYFTATRRTGANTLEQFATSVREIDRTYQVRDFNNQVVAQHTVEPGYAWYAVGGSGHAEPCDIQQIIAAETAKHYNLHSMIVNYR